jgi:hypothetical protein
MAQSGQPKFSPLRSSSAKSEKPFAVWRAICASRAPGNSGCCQRAVGHLLSRKASGMQPRVLVVKCECKHARCEGPASIGSSSGEMMSRQPPIRAEVAPRVITNGRGQLVSTRTHEKWRLRCRQVHQGVCCMQTCGTTDAQFPIIAAPPTIGSAAAAASLFIPKCH